MLVVCQRWVEDRDRQLNIDPSSSDQSSTSFSSWLGLLNHGSLRAASPQSASWFSCWHLVPQLTPTAPDYIIVSRPPVSTVPPLIYTGASLDWRLSRGLIYNSKSLLSIPLMLSKGRARADTKWHQYHHKSCQNKVEDNIRLPLGLQFLVLNKELSLS